MELVREIRTAVENLLENGYQKFIVFPFGDIGIRVKQILNEMYGVSEIVIIDNHLCHYQEQIKPTAYLNDLDLLDYGLILASTNAEIYRDLLEEARRFCEDKQIAQLASMKEIMQKDYFFETRIGKYSYGPICCNQPLIEEIGAFCSFAIGVAAVPNHETRFVTTHDIIFAGKMMPGKDIPYSSFYDDPWCLKGVCPHDVVKKRKRSRIGNDVWLGRNVLITNGADIGNGVIAGAGAVITKDIPDYAVVGGVPARIIKYRYNPKQIEELLKIRWWNWSDDEIRERYDDLYLPIDEFIEKYKAGES